MCQSLLTTSIKQLGLPYEQATECYRTRGLTLITEVNDPENVFKFGVNTIPEIKADVAEKGSLCCHRIVDLLAILKSSFQF